MGSCVSLLNVKHYDTQKMDEVLLFSERKWKQTVVMNGFKNKFLLFFALGKG